VPLTSSEVLEHGLDGVQVVLGRHVEHRVVLVVELAVRLGAVVVAADQVLEVVVVRLRWRSGFIATKPVCCRKPG
jgi:hypothetical protein